MSQDKETGLHIPPSFACPACHFLFPLTDEFFDSYFSEGTAKCPRCSEPFDVWTLTIKQFEEGGYVLGSLSAVGAQTSFFKVSLRRGKVTELDLTAHGIPADSRILALGYAPGPPGAVFPAEFYGNWPPRHTIPHQLNLYPVPFREGPNEEPVGVSVVWVSKDKNAYVSQSLVDAAEQYLVNKYDAMVVPANVAVEFSVGLVVALFLSRFAGRERLDKFMQEDASYDAQLNVLLPMVAGMLGAPPLPDHIRGLLNRLRKLRNEMAHKGLLLHPIEPSEATQLLAAAFFGVRYALIVGKPMLDSNGTKDKPQDDGEGSRSPESGRSPGAKSTETSGE